MKKLLQIHFPYAGPFGQEMAESAKTLAESIVNEPGFLWKIWTENEQTQEAGGIYLFEDEATALSYLKMHSARLKAMGVPEVFWKIFDINEALTKIDKGNILP